MEFPLLESLPIATIYVGVAVLMLLSCELGYQFGTRFQLREDREAPTSTGPMVGGLLGMLAFVLDFSFSTVAESAPSTNTALAIPSINEVIDMREMRVSGALRNRILDSVWIALFAISALTMTTMGVQIGFMGKRRLLAVIPLSLAFAVLATLVVDLDRPQRGLITVSQQSLIDLQRSMTGNPE